MNKIVNSAREWLGTPYHHQARLKGVGVDCVGLVIGVARDLCYVAPDFDVTGYTRQPDGEMLELTLAAHLLPVEQDDMQPGDVVLVAFDSLPTHVGIVGDYVHGGLSMIHAAGKQGKVLETRLLFTQAMRFVRAYRFMEVA